MLAAAFALALFARRYEQLVHPQVWNEDGIFIVRQLVDAGPVSLLWPVNGYLVSVSRLVSFAALSVSFVYYPLVSTILAWIFIVAVALAIALSPIVVRGGPLLSLAALFVPSDPEVFGLPLYTFWWAGLLILLAALWRRAAGGTGWRLAFVIVGGLSSPLVFLALPLFVYRAAVFRARASELVVAAAALACGAIQVAVLITSHNVTERTAPSIANALALLPKFVGSYAFGAAGRAEPGAQAALLAAGAIVTLCFAAVAIRAQARHASVLFALAYLWFGAIALSAARVDVAALDPVLAGPRYFFYPFVLEGWFLLHVALSPVRAPLRAGAVALLALAAFSVFPVLSRAHDDLRWRANLAYCAHTPAAEAYPIAIETDGQAGNAWHLLLTGEQCRALLARDPVLRLFPSLRLPLFAYVPRPVTLAALPAVRLASARSIVANGWNGSDSQHSRFPGLVVVGSFRTGDADRGLLALRLRRGERVLYRSGPVTGHQRVVVPEARSVRFDESLPVATDWMVLEFSNPRLPARFTAVFRDDGANWGEWSAVALAARER